MPRSPDDDVQGADADTSATSSSPRSSSLSSSAHLVVPATRASEEVSPAPTLTPAAVKGNRCGRVTLTCPVCQKVFDGDASLSGVRSNYARHLRTHTKEKPYRCPFCADAFSTSSNKRRHVRARHAELASPATGPRRTSRSGANARQSDSAAPNVLRRRQGTLSSPALDHTEEGSMHGVESHRRSRTQLRAPPPFALPRATAVNATTRPADVDKPTPGLLRKTARIPHQEPHATDRDPLNSEGEASPSTPQAAAPAQCRHCGKYFAWRSTLTRHEQHCKELCPRRSTSPTTRHTETTQTTSPASAPAAVRASQDSGAQGAKGAVVFTCEWCELDVSSASRLRRHMRYYCPFRDDVFADPFEDADARQGSPALTHAHVPRTRAEVDGEGDSDASAQERDAFVALGRTTGLKFYEDANRSDGEAETDEEAADEVTADGRPGRSRRALRARGNDTLLWLFESAAENEEDDENEASGEHDPDEAEALSGGEERETRTITSHTHKHTHDTGSVPLVAPELVVLSSATASSGTSSAASSLSSSFISTETSLTHPPARRRRRLDDRTASSLRPHWPAPSASLDDDSDEEDLEEVREDDDEDDDLLPQDGLQLDFKRRPSRGNQKRSRRIMRQRLRYRERERDSAPHSPAPASSSPQRQEHSETSAE